MCLVPAQATIFKETSWSENFNEFSTPYHIPWICIIWTIFLEVIFQSVAQHFICMNASAWVIHTSKLWMYKRGPGIWTKKVWQFSCFQWLIRGRSVYHLFRRKLHNSFHPPLGQRLSWTAECCALQSRQAVPPPCAVQRDALGPCAMNAAHWLIWWIRG